MKLSGLVSACEDAWKDIQSTFDDVPEAVIVVGSGGRRATTLLGHFAKNSWDNEENEVHEVLLVAENLNRTAQEIFTTLLHEAVHGIAHSRGIKDVSGKRHNKRFALLCESVGMIPPESPDPKLDVQLKLCRKLNLVPKNSKKTTWLAECQCERKLRLPKKTIVDPYDLQIVCQECGGSFFMNEEEIDAFNDLGA
jgi:predicted SprT family Zn-dependent metalloprotease